MERPGWKMPLDDAVGPVSQKRQVWKPNDSSQDLSPIISAETSGMISRVFLGIPSLVWFCVLIHSTQREWNYVIFMAEIRPNSIGRDTSRPTQTSANTGTLLAQHRALVHLHRNRSRTSSSPREIWREEI